VRTKLISILILSLFGQAAFAGFFDSEPKVYCEMYTAYKPAEVWNVEYKLYAKFFSADRSIKDCESVKKRFERPNWLVECRCKNTTGDY
jgi:hypothetical protein